MSTLNMHGACRMSYWRRTIDCDRQQQQQYTRVRAGTIAPPTALRFTNNNDWSGSASNHLARLWSTINVRFNLIIRTMWMWRRAATGKQFNHAVTQSRCTILRTKYMWPMLTAQPNACFIRAVQKRVRVYEHHSLYRRCNSTPDTHTHMNTNLHAHRMHNVIPNPIFCIRKKIKYIWVNLWFHAACAASQMSYDYGHKTFVYDLHALKEWQRGSSTSHHRMRLATTHTRCDSD